MLRLPQIERMQMRVTAPHEVAAVPAVEAVTLVIVVAPRDLPSAERLGRRKPEPDLAAALRK